MRVPLISVVGEVVPFEFVPVVVVSAVIRSGTNGPHVVRVAATTVRTITVVRGVTTIIHVIT